MNQSERDEISSPPPRRLLGLMLGLTAVMPILDLLFPLSKGGSDRDRILTRGWLRLYRLSIIALLVMSFLVAVASIDLDEQLDGRGRGKALAVVTVVAARLAFVPVGDVQDPLLLWTARILLGVGLVAGVLLYRVTSVRVRRIRERRSAARSGNPAVRTSKRLR